jgi:DNA-binding Lrp family transcriptional regulator
MSDNIVKNDNYYVVQGWMRNVLGLKGYALEIYAIIYGFSQVSHQEFTASINYLCEWIGASRPTVINTLKDLVDRGYLTKESKEINNVIYNRYRALTPEQIEELTGGSKNSLLGSKKILLGGKEILPNNIDNNIKNKSLPKGKEEQAPKKSYKDIFEAKENYFIEDALVKFINYCKGKNYNPRIDTVEKFAKTLRENAGSDRKIAEAMVKQSIDNGWKDIYSLKKNQKQTAVYKPFNPDTETLAKDENGNNLVY